MTGRNWPTDEQVRAYDLARAMIGKRIAECSERLGAEGRKNAGKKDENRIAEILAMKGRLRDQRDALDIFDLAGNIALVEVYANDAQHKASYLIDRLMHPMHSDIVDLANLPCLDDIPNSGRDLALGRIERMREKGEPISPSLLALEKRLRDGD